ncbi:MAG TPA: hypothetical protein VM513_00375 [Kofleriaceae bacterium]|nr:hypothetical protein [Kofleriaceae bacterium]
MMKLLSLGFVIALAACGGSEADELGVGAQCTSNDDCNPDIGPTCLTQFKGGYCGLTGCQLDADCPEDSACVMHDDGVNYCFRICADKAQCNANRDVDNEANCSGTADFVEGAMGRKACVPPSSGI